MVSFNISDLVDLFDPQTFSRGKTYLKQGRILEFREHKEESYVDARVRGSGSKVYKVRVAEASTGLICRCTCPVGYNCKHAAAVALYWLDVSTKAEVAKSIRIPPRPDSKPTEASSSKKAQLQKWLDTLPPNPASQPPLMPIPGKHQLLYFLKVTPSGKARITIRKAYLKKSGEWSQITHYSPNMYELGFHRPGHLELVDASILQLIVHNQNNYEFFLSGKKGFLALTEMLRSNRLLLEESYQPLDQGAEQTLSFCWKPTDKQHLRLSVELSESEQWQLIVTEPPCYLDEKRGLIGPLQSHIDADRLHHLLQFPEVHQDELRVAAPSLRLSFPKEQLPLPEEPDLKEVSTPQPKLTLVSSNKFDLAIPGLLFSFVYGDLEIPVRDEVISETVQTVMHNGKTYLLTRNAQQEKTAIARMVSMNLVAFEDLHDQHLFWSVQHSRPTELLNQWQRLIDHELPQLEKEGWLIETDPSYQLKISPAELNFNIQDSSNHWFEFSLAINYGDYRLSTTELVATWLEEGRPDQLVIPFEDEWVSLDTQPLHSIHDLLQALYKSKKLDRPVRLPAYQAAQLEALNLDDRQAPLTRKLIRQLNHFSGLEPVPVPEQLNATLRSYQQEGLNWLNFLHQYSFGGILADDMGLGKTLQSLALIQHLKNQKQLKKPVLVIAPTSLMGNWKREAEHFAPQLKTLVLHGAERHSQFNQIKASDLVITSYPLIARDLKQHLKHTYALLILDEAQAIKNPRTQAAKNVRDIKAACRICLTGTPLENHLGELWALMDFALPGLLGGEKTFKELYRNPIENAGDNTARQQLVRKVAPFMLRRDKNQVVKELPPKTEIIEYVELEGEQRQLYESVRISMEKRIRDLINKQGMERSHIEFLDALLKLRQACIAPELVKLDEASGIKTSAKLEWLEHKLPEMLEEGRKILLFSQFTQALALIEQQLKKQGIHYSKLTGQTRKRQEAIDAFQQGKAGVFLISLKAGGSGLNLTQADTIIHLDPWWNPAVENQATDRAYRIGQDKPVFVYKLVATQTVEERIQTMQKEKQALADQLFDATGKTSAPQNKEDLLALLS